MFWENFEGEAGDSIDKFCSLGFASPRVFFENMTVDANSELYPDFTVDERYGLLTFRSQSVDGRSFRRYSGWIYLYGGR